MYCKFPNALIKDKKYKKRSNDAKLLYTLMFARCEMSLKNNWYDEDNKAYIYFTISEMSELLGVSKPTAVNVFRQLKAANLVTVGKREGKNSPRLYVKNLLSKKESYFKNDSKSDTGYGIDLYPPSYDSDEIGSLLFAQYLEP